MWSKGEPLDQVASILDLRCARLAGRWSGLGCAAARLGENFFGCDASRALKRTATGMRRYAAEFVWRDVADLIGEALSRTAGVELRSTPATRTNGYQRALRCGGVEWSHGGPWN